MLNGDKASGISYCAVTLIGVEKRKRLKTSIGVYYHDEYAREGNQWLIMGRESTFARISGKWVSDLGHIIPQLLNTY